jgi:hypothetical protein
MATINPFQGPINYSADVQSPFEAVLGGFKLGSDVATIQATQKKRELETTALAQAQQRQTDLANLYKNPNASAADYQAIAAFLPKDQAEIVTKGFEAKTKLQQQNDLLMGGQVYSAVKAGNVDIAKQLLTDQATALRNSGREDEAKAAEASIKLIDLNPTGAQATIGLYMARLPDGMKYLEAADKALSTVREEAQAPAKLKEATAKADQAVADATSAQAKAKNAPEKEAADAALATAQAAKAKVDAEFARAKAVLDAQQQAATLRKTDADILIAKENNRIAALNAAAAKELNAVKRDEILQKREDATDKRDQAKRDQDSLLGNQLSSIDNFLNTAIRATNTPLSVRQSATGPVASRLPTVSQDVADFEGLIETLGAQAFLAQIPQIKGTGSLSENEGNKLQASLQNLSLKQSPQRLQENINEAVRLLTKARENIATRSGKAVAPPDVPAALQVTVQLPNGQTANFPNQAAADAFKKQAGIK